MKRTKKETILRIVILFIGLVIAHFGVTLFLLSNLGADPFNVLIQGFFRSMTEATGWSFLSHGNVHQAACLLIILVLLFVDKSYIKIGTILCMFCGGPIIDFFTWLMVLVFGESYSLAVKIVMLVLGCVILAFGMTIVIKSDAGTGPNDLVAIVISDKSKIRFGIMRIAVDFTFVLIGALLGGIFGVGTIVCAFLVGPIADFFLPKNEKMIGRILKKFMDPSNCDQSSGCK